MPRLTQNSHPFRACFWHAAWHALSVGSTGTIPPQQSPPCSPCPVTKHSVEVDAQGGGGGGTAGPGNGFPAGMPNPQSAGPYSQLAGESQSTNVLETGLS